MNIIELEGKNIERTEDCKNALNEALGVKNWKRLYKLKAGEYDGDVRCFKAIKEIAKLYYTHEKIQIVYGL